MRLILSAIALILLVGSVNCQPETTKECTDSLADTADIKTCALPLPSQTQATWIMAQVTASTVPPGYQISINVSTPTPEVLNAPIDALSNTGFYIFALKQNHGASSLAFSIQLVALNPSFPPNASASYTLDLEYALIANQSVTTNGAINIRQNEELLTVSHPFAAYTAQFPASSLPAVFVVVSQVLETSPTTVRFAPLRVARDEFALDYDAQDHDMCTTFCASDLNPFKVGAVATYVALNAPTDLGQYYISLGNREALKYTDIASAPYVYNLAATVTTPQPMGFTPPTTNWTWIDTFFHAPSVFSVDLKALAVNKQVVYPTYITLTLESYGTELYVYRKAIPSEELSILSTTRDQIFPIASRDPTLTRPLSIVTENILLPTSDALDTYYVTVVPYSFMPDGPEMTPNSKIRIGVNPTTMFAQPKPLLLGQISVISVYALHTTYLTFEILDSTQNYTLTLLEGHHLPYTTHNVKIRIGATLGALPVSAETADFFSFDNVVHLEMPEPGRYYVAVFGYLPKPAVGSVVENPALSHEPLHAALILESGKSRVCSAHGQVNIGLNLGSGPSIACACDSGYIGANCEFPCPGHAKNSTCSGHGWCVSTPIDSVAICTCAQGYSGLDCSVSCTRATCNGHGSCITVNSEPRCICDKEYAGTSCTTICPLDNQGNVCSHHGECNYDTGSAGAKCDCFDAWGGDACQDSQTPISTWISLVVSQVVIAVVVLLFVAVIVLLILAVIWKRKLNKIESGYVPLNLEYGQ